MFMGLFVGREDELRYLEGFMEDPVCFGCAVYGARGVGKTALLRRFAEGRRHVHLGSIPGSERTVVDKLTNQLARQTVSDGRLDTLQGFFDLLIRVCEESPTLVILDDYQFLSASADHADSCLRGFMDETARRTGTKVIVCGPHTSVRDIVDDRTGPLYNRFGYSLHVGPLPFGDTCLLHEGMCDRDLVMMYMVFGGVPSDHIRYGMPTFGDVVRSHFGSLPN